MTRHYIGIDAGASRHHIAIVDERGSIEAGGLPAAGLITAEVVALLDRREAPAQVIAIDAPAALATAGARSRPCEVQLQREVGCQIFFTPDETGLSGHWWEAFVRSGLALHDALRGRARGQVIEVFPTASRTVWAGARPAGEPKAQWSDRVLRQRAAAMGVQASLPARWNQHQRDALTAAWTALECGTQQALLLDGPDAPPGIWVPRRG